MEVSALWFAFIAAAAVILREGLEAALILAALSGVLRKLGAAAGAFRMLWIGALSALLLSIALVATTTNLAIHIPVQYQEIFEGVVGILAVIVLFFVINWLFHYTYIHRWRKFIESGARRALGSGAVAGLAFLGFVIVIREGIETALFIPAMIAAQNTTGTIGGIFVGAIVTAIAIWGILQGSIRLPIRAVFTFTTTILIILGLTILGSSIHEFQEIGWLPETRLAFMPDAGWLRKPFGIYPYLETLLAQLAMGLALVASWHIAARRDAPKQAGNS
ncbi:FTR1 family protein [bacterium]|nr:FTR1 family protein [bacterium]